MKIVLDTNVVVSGVLQAQGNPAQVLSLALSGAIQICHDWRAIDRRFFFAVSPPWRLLALVVQFAGQGFPENRRFS